MDLTHRFTVPTSLEETWGHFNDIAAVAECFPGAQVTSVDGDSFAGSVKVKLGPIALLYNGTGTFVEKDDTDHRFVVDAKGRDKRGNGTAGATVTVTMHASGNAESSTDVNVFTDLSITGKPAQFGRGVMQDVSDKLLGQFVTCLESRLTAAPQAAAAAAAPETPAATAAPETPAAEPAQSEGAGAVEPPEVVPTPVEEPLATGGMHFTEGHPQHEEAIDLGATVLPVLVKAYWKQGLGLLVVLLLLRHLVKRRSS